MHNNYDKFGIEQVPVLTEAELKALPTRADKIKAARQLTLATAKLHELVKAYGFLESANKALLRAWMNNAFIATWEVGIDHLMEHLAEAIEEGRKEIAEATRE